MQPKLRALLPAALVTLLLDQASKLWTVASLAYRGPPLELRAADGLKQLGHSAASPTELVVIPDALTFVHAQNPAAAMGMMLGYEHKMLVFGVFTLVALAALTAMYRALGAAERLQAAGIGVLVGGILGNAIDRAHKGTVTDMIKVIVEPEPLKAWMINAIGTNEWYTFNIADAAIFVGVGLVLLASIFAKDHEVEDTGSRPSLDDELPSGSSPTL